MDENGINQMLKQAAEHHRAGRLRDAEVIYRQILSQNPDHPRALHMMGTLADQCGQSALAVELLNRAVAVKPDEPHYLNALGLLMLKLGHMDRAIAVFSEAVRLAPTIAESQNYLGSALAQRGLLKQAAAALDNAARLNPASAEFHYNLGTILGQMGQVDRAIAEYRKAIELKPDFADAHNNLGIALQYMGQVDAAMETYQKALRYNPNLSGAYSNIGSILKEQGRHGEAMQAYRWAMEIDPANNYFHDNLVYLMLFVPDCSPEAIRQELGEWNRRHAIPLMQRIRPYTQDRNPDRRLRIGYVSADFRDHVIGRNMLPLFGHHNHHDFEITCYSNTLHVDGITDRFRAMANRWHDVRSWTDAQLAEQVRHDGIDILVDLSLHLEGNRLLAFAEKPAPVQMTFAGYPGSTGLETIDYRLTDPFLDPPGMNDGFCSEQSIRMPETFWCYPMMGDEPAVNPPPFEQSGRITFGCLNNFCKINDGVLKLWAKVVRAVEGSRLLILAEPGAHRQSTLDTLGLTSGAVEFLDKRPRRQYMEYYHQIDIALDTIPYNGHTTSLDAAFMGVPTVTRIGQTVVGRAGWSLLSNLKLTELAASNDEQFISIATKLANDRPRLTQLRATLRQRMQNSPLMDGPRFARNIEFAYRAAWQNWCSSESADSHNSRAAALMQRRRFSEAAAALENAVRLNPASADFHYNLGTVLAQMGQLQRAVTEYHQAIELNPDFALAYNNLGIALQFLGRVDEATAAYQTALRLDPSLANAHCNIGSILKEQGRPAEAAAAYQKSLALNPADSSTWSNLLYALQYDGDCTDEQLRHQHEQWNRIHAAPLKKFIRPHGNSREPDRRLHIGYVSPDFYQHAECYFVLPLLNHADHTQFETHLYSSVVSPDAITGQYRGACDAWHEVLPLTDHELAEQIRRDQIDILIDLTMHMRGTRIMAFAEKPAPVQMTWLAYPGSTGLTTIDYRITDRFMDLPGQNDSWCTEKAIHLPDGWVCYDPVTELAPINELPAKENGYITFGSFNNFSKINESVLKLWSRLLRELPTSRLLLLAEQSENCRRVVEILNVSPSRVQFIGRRSRFDYLQLYHQIDIGLDPFPYNGITTTCDAVLMGVPVVNLVGKRAQARAGLGLLTTIGLRELITNSQDEFIRTAVQLAGDLPRLTQYRGSLRQKMQGSVLMDHAQFARNMEAAFRAAWRRWCAG